MAVNARDSEGRTALQICASQGWQNVVQDLVNRKDIDINSADSQGITALATAIQYHHQGVIRAILSVTHLDVDVSVRR